MFEKSRKRFVSSCFAEFDPDEAIFSNHVFERNLLDEPIVFVDVGCQKGLSKKWRFLEERLNVYGFDPIAEEIEVLKNNINRLPHKFWVPEQATWIEAALGAENGERDFFIPNYNTQSASFFPEHAETGTNLNFLGDSHKEITRRSVTVRKFDDVMDEFGISHVNYLKIDAEGAETEVLSGALEFLKSGRVSAIELENPLRSEVLAILEASGFRIRDLFMRVAPEEPLSLGRAVFRDRTLQTLSSGFGVADATDGLFLLQQDRIYQSKADLLKDLCIFELCYAPDVMYRLIENNKELLGAQEVEKFKDILQNYFIKGASREVYFTAKQRLMNAEKKRRAPKKGLPNTLRS